MATTPQPARAATSARRRRLTTGLSIALLVLAVGVAANRAVQLMNVPGTPDAAHWALQDFRDAVYFPARSMLDGNDPYDSPRYMAMYPVGQTFPPYSPLLLLVHAPLAMLPLASAQVIYFILNILLTVVLAHAVLRLTGGASVAGTALLAGVVLLSRPGQFNVLLGQPTLLLVTGVYLALFAPRARPWLAAAGLALTSMKPTYAVPLALLLLARGDRLPVVMGTALGTLGAVLGALGPMAAAGGPLEFLSIMPHNYAVFVAQPAADPAASMHRVDAGVILSRLLDHPPGALLDALLFAAVVGLGALALRRTARDDVALVAGVVCSTILACVYQSAYNLVMLMLPAVALLRSRSDPAWLQPGWLRGLLGISYAGLALNYLSSENAARLLQLDAAARLAVGTLNSAAVLLLFATYCALALGRSAPARDTLAATPTTWGERA